MLRDISDTFHFEPHFGWKDHVEQDSALPNSISLGEEVTHRR
jgi:hypothetical protein